MTNFIPKINAGQLWIIVVQIAGLIWLASALYGQVDNNRNRIETTTEMVRIHSEMIQDHEARLQVKDSENKDMSRRLVRIEEKLDRLIEQSQ